MMTHFVGLDVSQKMTAIWVVDNAGRRLWRGQCPTAPEQIAAMVRRHAGHDPRIGIETRAMTPWLVHELRALGLEVICLDARHTPAPPSRCKSTRRIRTTRRDWLRSFAPADSGRFTLSRSTATARVRFSARGLNSSA
jgi:transposase